MDLGYECYARFPSYQLCEKISQGVSGLGTCWELKPAVQLCHLATWASPQNPGLKLTSLGLVP